LKIQKKEIVLAEVPVCHVCIDSPMRVDEEAFKFENFGKIKIYCR